jgi:serine/threonine-protein kinase
VFVRNGKYTLFSPDPVGVGGLGQIYRAYDPGMDQVVAVKEILPTLHPGRRQQAVEKFQHEARLHGGLKHAHIVQARTLETDHETGEQYLVCDFIAGGSLADQLRRGPLHPAAAIRVALDLLAGLDYLHQRLVIHCDIKPSNILLVKDAQGRIVQALLADLGIARNLRAAPSTIGPGTVPSLTPEYCAPEQINPAIMLDPRADLYALGLVLGEMLSAQGPYKLALRRVAVGHPGPHPPRQDRAARRLFAIVSRATRDAPDERYQSAAEFSAALQAQARRFRSAPSSASRPLGAALVMVSAALFLVLAPLLVLLSFQNGRAADLALVAPTRPSTTSVLVESIAAPSPMAAAWPGVAGFSPLPGRPSSTPAPRTATATPSVVLPTAPATPTRADAAGAGGTPAPTNSQPTLVPW